MIGSGLIQRLKRREESAFTELVLSTSLRLMTVAKVYAHTHEDAKDVLQDTYIICFEKVPTFDNNDPKAFYSWLKKIAINTALSKNKKKYRHVEQSLELTEQDHPFDARIINELSKQELMELVFKLPTGFRQVFALFVIEGYSHKEIGEMLGISSSTSRSQFVRAKRVLQKKIQQQYSLDAI